MELVHVEIPCVFHGTLPLAISAHVAPFMAYKGINTIFLVLVTLNQGRLVFGKNHKSSPKNVVLPEDRF